MNTHVIASHHSRHRVTAGLSLSTYEPDWTHQKVIDRTAKVLKWCDLFLRTDKGTPHHSTRISEVFGQPHSQLSSYLRANLMIRTGKYEVGKKSLSYLLNQGGFDKITSKIDARVLQDTPAPLKEEHKVELAQLAFKYSEKADRYWHPLQNMRRAEKQAFWSQAGLPFNYDIEACAPTILLNMAKQHGLFDLVTAPIREYIDDKTKLRRHVASLVGISLHDSKRLINSLFNGARLVANSNVAAFQIVGYSKEKMALLQADHEVSRLRTAAKLMWRKIQRHSHEDLSTGKGKWGLYFRKEREVLDVIVQYLMETNNRHFTEHDGFRTEREVDLSELTMRIQVETGFDLMVKRTE
ncbi:MAG: hypothetical protein V4757_06750 [Pseudomonadota bacterium]